MEVRWLVDFCVLARVRQFSRAADEQNVTQPTFSRRIKMLEEEMGVQLIDRNTLPLSLTPAGVLFLAASEKILLTVGEVKEQCLNLERAEAEKLRFATNQSLYLSFYSHWAAQLTEGTELTLDLNATSWMGSDFVAALQQGDCDLMLCYWNPAIDFLRPLEGGDFIYETLGQEQLVPVTALNDQGLPKYSLPGLEHAPLPYIGYNSNSFLSPVIADHLRQSAETPQLLQVTQNSQAISIKAMITQGYGVGWLPQRLLEYGGEQGLVRAGDASWSIDLELRLYRLRANPSARLDALWQQIITAEPLLEH
ncbi:MAG: DNA-binding transcriptional LysR family regulator [Motiliproteus sp.]|jgi:DNA-binding transcriptional LysR family regulator